MSRALLVCSRNRLPLGDRFMTETTKISRRTVAKGMAWAVPAVAVSAAIPAYALSGARPSVTVIDACKQPGNSCNSGQTDYDLVKGYTFVVKLTNSSAQTIYLYSPMSGDYMPQVSITSLVNVQYSTARYFELNQGISGIKGPVGSVITLGPGETKYIVLSASYNASPNVDASGYLYFAWGHTQTAGADAQHVYTPKPPTVDPNTGQIATGWTGGTFNVPETKPCGTDCVPGGGTTLTSTQSASTTSTAPLSEEIVVDKSSSSEPAGPSASDSPLSESTVSEVQASPSTSSLDSIVEDSVG